MSLRPSNEQLALFARRVRRATSNEKSRHCFGVASGEYEFTFFPEVVRALEWLESLGEAEAAQAADPTDLPKATLRKIIS
jgi:hypothetical protein